MPWPLEPIYTIDIILPVDCPYAPGRIDPPTPPSFRILFMEYGVSQSTWLRCSEFVTQVSDIL